MRNWWRSIRDSVSQIKASGAFDVGDIVLVAVVVLVGFSAFALGQLAVVQEKQPAVRAFERSILDEPPLRVGGLVVGSRRGSKYHYPWCTGARSMNEENKIWFDSVEDAQEAGYAPAGNCTGLR